MRPKRSTKITLGATFAAIVAMAAAGACSEPEPDHAAICVDPKTEQRVDDDHCDDDGRSGFMWFYYPWHLGSPAVGSRVDVSSGSYTRPTSGRTSTVVPAGLGGSKYGSTGSGSGS